MTSELTTIQNTSGPELPALINKAGERAAWRFVEFFTVNIRNMNTRAAYGQAAGAFNEVRPAGNSRVISSWFGGHAECSPAHPRRR